METGHLIEQFPHCDSYILHAPGECKYCDAHPEWQELRQSWGIAFTGHADEVKQVPGRHAPVLPCPADFLRPPGSSADHRRWGGNKPTSAADDPSWPVESAASRAMYGDLGGRASWPLGERVLRGLRRPLEDIRKRRRGWHKKNGWWTYP